MPIKTEEEFHKAIHGSVGTPSPGMRVIVQGRRRRVEKYSRVHTGEWADSQVNLGAKTVLVNVYIDFQRNSLSESHYRKLCQLSEQGIRRYWSRTIRLGDTSFTITVNTINRKNQSIDVDLYIEDSKSYARSHNTGIIDASFIYNKGFYRGMNSQADRNFMLTSAHEFGHSVLEVFAGKSLSWTHKGSTTLVTQKAKPDTPGYPSAGEIDLMKYYNSDKGNVPASALYNRTIADEKDVKRLIWISNIKIK